MKAIGVVVMTECVIMFPLEYEFVVVQMSKINALVLRFFHITMHSPVIHTRHKIIINNNKDTKM